MTLSQRIVAANDTNWMGITVWISVDSLLGDQFGHGNNWGVSFNMIVLLDRGMDRA